jgi:hypothetical protein
VGSRLIQEYKGYREGLGVEWERGWVYTGSGGFLSKPGRMVSAQYILIFFWLKPTEIDK